MSARARIRRLAAISISALAFGGLTPAGASARVTAANWDSGQQRQVVGAGLMGYVSGRNFGGAQQLSGAAANSALAALATRLNRDPAAWGLEQRAPRIRTRSTTVSVAGFDTLVVDQLGLADVAAHVQHATAAAGLRPPSYFGTEVVARFLGLRYTHPVGSEQLALFPGDPITRAEAAWSLAQVLDNGDWSVNSARATLTKYELPAMSTDQLSALRIAISRIGYPYIWGGTTDDTADGLPHGGFDCSGFVWRVFKLSGLSWGKQIQGRTAAQMAGEIPRRRRLSSKQLRPGDLLFFGSAHLSSAATSTDITHAGIYLGDNWVINSADQGVYVLPLTGSWLGNEFAWGRRVLP